MILLQTLIFALFILGNAYQGVITSFMIAQEEPSKVKSFEEFLEGNQKVLLGGRIDMLMRDNEKYQRALRSGIVNNTGSQYYSITFDELYSENQAIITTCDQAEFNIYRGIAKNFYIVEEKLFPYFIRLQTIFLSRYLKQWQLLMDWSFEAGLTQAWEQFMNIILYFRKEPIKLQVLKFDEIFVVFNVMITCFCFAGFAFCCEIFWHNIGGPYLEWRKHKNDNLSIREVQRRRFKFLKRKPKTQMRKLKVRRIQVQPINPESDG
jgi:hypothetical protein